MKVPAHTFLIFNARPLKLERDCFPFSGSVLNKACVQFVAGMRSIFGYLVMIKLVIKSVTCSSVFQIGAYDGICVTMIIRQRPLSNSDLINNN